MSRFNPDLLLGDELSYEALLRGLPHANVRVTTLRQNLRGANQDVPIDRNRLTELDLSYEVETCIAKYNELTSIAPRIREDKTPIEILRTTYRVEHLTRRIGNLLMWPGENVLTVETQTFADQALRELPGIIKALRRTSEKFSRDEIQDALSKVNVSPISSPSAEINPEITLEKDMVPGDDLALKAANTETQLFSKETQHSIGATHAEPVLQTRELQNYAMTTPNACSLDRPVRPQTRLDLPIQTRSRGDEPQLYETNLFAKITHPIQSVLSLIPLTDGLSVTKLMEFMKCLLNIKDIPQVTDDQVLPLLLAYARPPLRERIQQAVYRRSSIDALHADLIQHFIPTGIYEELKRTTVLRTQRSNERLASFVSDVRESSRVLRVQLTENEIVENILVRLSVDERSRLVLMNRPRTFRELEQCCIHSANVWHSDQVRRNEQNEINYRAYRPSTSRTVTVPNGTNQNRNQNTWTPSRANNESQNTRRCYNCGGQNHSTNNCFKNKRNVNSTNPKNA